jgi:hypothetical protein
LARFRTAEVRLNGEPVPDWSAYADPYPVRLRGGKKSYCTRCPECRQIVYTPMGTRYVLRQDLPDSPTFGTHYGGIIVGAAVASRLMDRKWPRVSIKPLPIKDKPADGFPADLSQIRPDQERALVLPKRDQP